jgi:Rrf2 family protein
MSFTLTRKADYALAALVALARQAQLGRRPLSARQIAQQHQLPHHLLSNLLKQLHQAKIVCSKRGPMGGYTLCHDPAEVSMLRVIQAIEGPVSAAVCCQDSEPEPCAPCRSQPLCPIVSPMHRFNHRVREFLDSITLHDLMSDDPAPARPHLVPLHASRSEP